MTDTPNDHFHRSISGNARTRTHVVLGGLFVLVWFGMDVEEVIYNHWFSPAPVCSRVEYNQTFLPPPPILFVEPSEDREI